MKPPVFDPNWPDEVAALYMHDVREMWDPRVAPQIWNQYHNQIDLYLALAGGTPLRIMDVGCAQGTLALLLAERGHSVTAVDIRPHFLAYARSRYTNGDIHFVAANVLDDDLPPGQDLIFANQIIEHLVYPDRFLTRLATLLKPGGRLVVTTPNAEYVKNTLPTYGELGDPQQWEHLQFTADGDGHFFAYTAVELSGLFTQAGFRDVGSHFFETPWVSGHLRVRHVHRVAPVRLLRALDRMTLGLGALGRKSAHQLLVTGRAAASI